MSELVKKRIHCLGAAGAGMLPLAIMAKEAGYQVTVQDDVMTEKAQRLFDQANVQIANNDEFLSGEVGLIVRSSAISLENPLVQSAVVKGWSVCRRGEFFATLVENRKLIAVAGSHGKTTTTAMLHEWLKHANVDHSLMLGGLFSDDRLPGQYSESEWIVAELDESDGTIEEFSPEVTVILNVDYDHHTQYPSEADYQDAFRRLVSRTQGKIITSKCLSDSLGFGSLVEADNLTLIGENISYRFKDSFRGGGNLILETGDGETPVQIDRSSSFNVANAAFSAVASVAVAGLDSLPRSVFFSALERRQSCDYLSPTVSVFNDYAHHPEEIGQQIASLKKQRAGSVWVVFQPHRFTRTRHLLQELSESLGGADRLYLLDVYAASEDAVEGGRGKDLFETCKERLENCFYVESEGELLNLLGADVDYKDQTNVLFLGAGMTHSYADSFAKRLSDLDEPWGAFNKALGRAAKESSRLLASETLANKTTMRIGGCAERYFEPSSEEELSAALVATIDLDIPTYMLGRGSNLIVPDEGVRGLVIRLSHPYWKQYRMIGEGRIFIGAGMRIKELCGVAAKLGLAGFEFLEGIPGNLGGALRMNAGAMGGWVFDVVESVRFIGSDGKIYEKDRAQLTYGYRHCLELMDAVAIGAVLRANATGQEKADIRAAIGTYQEKRHESQPREPSAGCIFKNPEGDSAGKIIDELGLKGTKIGGAKISEIHGNFIVNTGRASSQDVIELVKLARRVAWDKKRIVLEPEALLYGAEWKVVLK